jgi:hypothetical protein
MILGNVVALCMCLMHSNHNQCQDCALLQERRPMPSAPTWVCQKPLKPL